MADKKETEPVETAVSGTNNPAEAVSRAAETTGAEKHEYKEITIKFGKGYREDPFTAKDGKSYVEIKIPNTDPEDHSPWASFILPENHVHEDKFGKGLWAKIPENGHTGIRKPVCTGQDENGKNLWSEQKTVVTNAELKARVEAYREKPRESVKEKLSKEPAIDTDKSLKIYTSQQKDELPFR